MIEPESIEPHVIVVREPDRMRSALVRVEREIHDAARLYGQRKEELEELVTLRLICARFGIPLEIRRAGPGERQTAAASIGLRRKGG